MKANGMTYVCTKYGIVLSILTLIMAVPVLSQESYIFQKNNSFSNKDKRLASGPRNYYAESDPVGRQIYAASMALSVSTLEINKHTKKRN